MPNTTEHRIKVADLFRIIDEQTERKRMDERMVLKLDGEGHEPQQDSAPMPPTDMPEPAPAEPQDDNMSNFGPKFDAGVEADPNSEPDKYIQQLTGKLATELRKYLEQSNDADIAKYVLGMIIAQACKPLTDADKKEIIDKINEVHGTEASPEEPEPANEPAQEPVQNDQEPEEMMQNQFEALQRRVTNEVLEAIGDDDENKQEERPLESPVLTSPPEVQNTEKNRPFIPKQYREGYHNEFPLRDR